MGVNLDHDEGAGQIVGAALIRGKGGDPGRPKIEERRLIYHNLLFERPAHTSRGPGAGGWIH